MENVVGEFTRKLISMCVFNSNTIESFKTLFPHIMNLNETLFSVTRSIAISIQNASKTEANF